ncbi:MAG: hypothetical protein AAF433_00535 [Bacteroidota bacterium]
MQRICYFPLLLLLLSACQPQLETVESCDEIGFCHRFQTDPKTGLQQGLSELFNPAGQVVEIANYIDGQLDGRLLRFNDRGDTLTVETYVNGQFEGPFRLFNEEEGYLRQVGQYINGAMNGQWKAYHANGQIAESVTFVDNQEEGPFKEWHPNGQRKAIGTYLEGDNEHGELWLYAENGELERLMDCNRGHCSSVWKIGDPGPVPQKD